MRWLLGGTRISSNELDIRQHVAANWLLSARGKTIPVLILLTVHGGLLAYSAARHSPTWLEPAFLASGISHWQFGRFELYRVNPPLVRMVAALPALVVGCETDWSGYKDRPGSRAEFAVGDDFIRANGRRSVLLMIYARWACIPFSLIGAYFAYRWARDLYGQRAGLITLTIYVFDPNLLSHGELITPDSACTGFGIVAGYTFWRWLKQPTWGCAAVAGGALGLAELSKMSWLVLFGCWPVLWLIWRSLEPRVETALRPTGASITIPCNVNEQLSSSHIPRSNGSPPPPSPSVLQLSTILLLGVYIINLGYAFGGVGTKIGEFQFVSRTLTGLDESGKPGNRFRNSWIGQLPVPFPEQFVLGFDSQKKDFEEFGQMSYLLGEWKNGGWWYYYVYGLLVKVPCGTWGLFVLVIVLRLAGHFPQSSPRDELVLLLPAALLLCLVSSQTAFNIHLRYSFPLLGVATIVLGSVCVCSERSFALHFLSVVLIAYSVASTLLVYPHHFAYFNDFVGGPTNGPRVLLGSNVDWGQDLLLFESWYQSHTEARPIRVAYCGLFPLSKTRIVSAGAPLIGDQKVSPSGELYLTRPDRLQPGWYALSVNELYHRSRRYRYFLSFKPKARVGYSILVYHITESDLTRDADDGEK